MPKRNFVFFAFVLCAEIPFEYNWNINPGHLLKKLEHNWPTKSNESLEMTQPNYIIVIYCHNFFSLVPYFLLVNECYLMSSEISMCNQDKKKQDEIIFKWSDNNTNNSPDTKWVLTKPIKLFHMEDTFHLIISLDLNRCASFIVDCEFAFISSWN